MVFYYSSKNWRLRVTVFVTVASFAFVQIIFSAHKSVTIVWSDANTIILQDSPTTSATTDITTNAETALAGAVGGKSQLVVAAKPNQEPGELTTISRERRDREQDRESVLENPDEQNQDEQGEDGEDVEQDGEDVQVRNKEEKEQNEQDNESESESEEPSSQLQLQRQTTPPSSFKGTKITRLSDAVDLYENVCIYRSQSNAKPVVRSYTATAQSLTHSSYYALRGGNEAFMLKTQGFPLEQWHMDSTTRPTKSDTVSSENPVLLIKEETIWTLTMYANPAHGLTDVIFTLVLDRYQRQQKYAQQQQHEGDESKPFYARYLIGKMKGFEDPTYRRKQGYGWLYEMMGVLNLIRPGVDAVQTHVPLTCFERLLVPSLHMQRFPVHRHEDPIGYQVFQQFADKPAQYTSYPKAALIDLHQRALASLNLPKEPWPTSTSSADTTSPSSSLSSPPVKHILLHVRAKKEKRKLTNALELKHLLETNYQNVNITLLKDDWLSYTFPQQAQTYNHYEYIITAHGAHLANAMFCRPHTKLIEIFCNKNKHDLNPNATLTQQPFNTKSHVAAAKAWYGGSYTGWFETFTRRLGMQHFEYGETYGSRCKGHGTNILMDIQNVVPLIVNRFGLVPKENVALTPQLVSNAETTIVTNNNNNDGEEAEAEAKSEQPEEPPTTVEVPEEDMEDNNNNNNNNNNEEQEPEEQPKKKRRNKRKMAKKTDIEIADEIADETDLENNDNDKQTSK